MPIQKLLLLPELSGTTVTGINSEPVEATGRSCATHTPELVNEELIGENNKGASSVAVHCLTASWTYVRYSSIIIVTSFNFQDKEKLVLDNVNFTVDQVRCSTSSHSHCIT